MEIAIGVLVAYAFVACGCALSYYLRFLDGAEAWTYGYLWLPLMIRGFIRTAKRLWKEQ